MNPKLKEAYKNVYPGWWELLDRYLPQIWAIDPDCDVIVKEKLGTLRIHPYSTKEEISWKDLYSITQEAETVSATVCEICGEPGHLRTDQSWWQTLCDRCVAMEPNERYRVGRIVSAIMIEEMEAEEHE